MEITGRYNSAIVFTDVMDAEATSQIYQLLNIPAFAGSQIRIMPDVHYGSGAVVGFTMTMNEFICPAVVGVDIGCGINAYRIGKVDFSPSDFDAFLKTYIQAGREVNSSRREKYFDPSDELTSLINKVALKEYDRIVKSAGTLGGVQPLYRNCHGRGRKPLADHPQRKPLFGFAGVRLSPAEGTQLPEGKISGCRGVSSF